MAEKSKDLNIILYYVCNIMETISFKLQEGILKKIDGLLRALHFNNRTEFIREAIRDKLNEAEKEKAVSELKKLMGTAKAHISDERHEQIREEVAKEYAKKFGIKLD